MALAELRFSSFGLAEIHPPDEISLRRPSRRRRGQQKGGEKSVSQSGQSEPLVRPFVRIRSAGERTGPRPPPLRNTGSGCYRSCLYLCHLAEGDKLAPKPTRRDGSAGFRFQFKHTVSPAMS